MTGRPLLQTDADLRQRCQIAEFTVRNQAIQIEALEEQIAEQKLDLVETRSRLAEYIEAFGPLESA